MMCTLYNPSLWSGPVKIHRNLLKKCKQAIPKICELCGKSVLQNVPQRFSFGSNGDFLVYFNFQFLMVKVSNRIETIFSVSSDIDLRVAQ